MKDQHTELEASSEDEAPGVRVQRMEAPDDLIIQPTPPSTSGYELLLVAETEASPIEDLRSLLRGPTQILVGSPDLARLLLELFKMLDIELRVQLQDPERREIWYPVISAEQPVEEVEGHKPTRASINRSPNA